MADVKWIKITTDIFDDEKMYAIETMQDGQLMELIWFKLLCLAGKCNNHGFLMISNKIAYTDEMLSKVFRIDIGSVQRALRLFQELEMIEVVENAYMISNWDLHQSQKGLEEIREQNRIRQQRHRDKQKKLALEEKSNVTVTQQNNVISSISISYSNSISNIVNYLNNINNSNYKSNSKNTVKHIRARLEEGFTEEDFYRVIDYKVSQWKNDAKMKDYLRPDTLFGTKFESYLNSAQKIVKEEPIVEVVINAEEEEEVGDDW